MTHQTGKTKLIVIAILVIVVGIFFIMDSRKKAQEREKQNAFSIIKQTYESANNRDYTSASNSMCSGLNELNEEQKKLLWEDFSHKGTIDSISYDKAKGGSQGKNKDGMVVFFTIRFKEGDIKINRTCHSMTKKAGNWCIDMLILNQFSGIKIPKIDCDALDNFTRDSK